MKVIKVTPRGYCHGVVNAVKMVLNLDIESLKKPVYILGYLVHNTHIINQISNRGIITLHDPSKTRMELLDMVDQGTVIFTAHGTASNVIEKAYAKGLDVINTVCSDVTKTEDLIEDYIAKDFDVVYIGKKNHPESESASMYRDRVFLITDLKDINLLPELSSNVVITNQTTMSMHDVYHLAESVKERFPQAELMQETCDATRIRQEAVMNLEADYLIVVGDKLSNNSNNLVKISNINGTLVQDAKELDLDYLSQFETIAVTSGASTPTQVTNEVIKTLESL
jgi:4-hydroxy-3-methylbut-2-enyl diphosphate reductase